MKSSADKKIHKGFRDAWRSATFQQVLCLPEFWSLGLGLCAAVGVVVLLTLAMFFEPERGNALLKVLNFHVLAGAPVGALEGAKKTVLPFWENFLFNGLITVAIISLFNTLFGLSCRRFFHVPALNGTLQDLKGDAHRQRKTWARFGIPGVFLFVFIPMPFTGPVVGSLLARFVGLRYWGALGTVVCASLTSILAWGYAADRVQEYLGDKVLNFVLWALILLTFGTAALVKLKNCLTNHRKKASEEDSTPDEEGYFDEFGDDEPEKEKDATPGKNL